MGMSHDTGERREYGGLEQDPTAVASLYSLDRELAHFEESLDLEVAEETFVDLYEGDVDEFYRMTFYVEDSLEEVQEAMPGSVFTELPDGYDRYELQDGDFTLALRFDSTHDETYEIDSDFQTLNIRAPTISSYYRKWMEAEQPAGDDRSGAAAAD